MHAIIANPTHFKSSPNKYKKTLSQSYVDLQLCKACLILKLSDLVS